MSDPSAEHARAPDSDGTSGDAEQKLADEEYIDLLIHRRREDDVTYDDLAHMAGFLYETDVSAEELRAVDEGEMFPHIWEHLESGAPLEDDGQPDDTDGPSPLKPKSRPSEAITGNTLTVDPHGDLDHQYENYLERREKWYPNREKLSFETFREVAQRWDDEYYEAFNEGHVKESDWSTINELERLLCVPPASRLLVTAVAASQNRLDEDADDGELIPEPLDEDGTEPTESVAPADASDSAPPSPADEPIDAPPADEEASYASLFDGTDAQERASEPQPADADDASESDDLSTAPGAPASRRPDDPPIEAATASVSSHSNLDTDMKTDELLKGLRAQRNAIDVSLDSIEERLEHYRQVREKIDTAIQLLEDDALAPLLGAVKQLHGIAGGDGNLSEAVLPDQLAETLADTDETPEPNGAEPSLSA